MKRLFEGSENVLRGEVTGEDEITFCDVSFERPGLGLPEGTPVELTIQPGDIEVVSIDHAHLTVYLESLIYKGDYNELVVWTGGRSLLIHSYLDQQVATDIGIRFDFDKIRIAPWKGGETV